MAKNKDLERKTRNFCLLLYPDCEEHMEALDKLMNSDWSVCGITHDKDEWSKADELKNSEHKEGTIKKSHMHLVIERGSKASPICRKGLAESLGINKTAIEPCDNLRGSKRYLLHLDDDDKVLYDVSEIFGNNADSVIKAIDKPTIDGNIEAPKLAEYISQCDYYLTTQEFVKYCCANRLYNLYRSSSHIFHRMIDEHNKAYIKAGANDE